MVNFIEKGKKNGGNPFHLHSLTLTYDNFSQSIT